jgi:hypothetical protein
MAAIAGIWLVANLLQLEVSYYSEWRFDSGTKDIVKFLRSRHPSNRPLTIRASWVYEPSLNFYIARYRLKNWALLDRGPLERPGDVWILGSEDLGKLQSMHLTPILKDANSGTVVAAVAPKS